MAVTNKNGHGSGRSPGQLDVPAATKLRRMLTDGDNLIVAPGVYDGFSARVALEVGFDCIYMVGPLPRFLPQQINPWTHG